MSDLFWPSWRDVRAGAWRWRFFRPEELASRGDGSLRIVPAALDRLDLARLELGRPLVINSAYRDPIYNARIGGAPLSRHKVGDAFDISLRGHDRGELLELCRRVGFAGFGFYQTFLHVDGGAPRHWYAGERSKELWIG